MAQTASTVNGFLPYLGYLVKDVGSRLCIMGHYLHTSRLLYPVMRHQNIRAYRGMLPLTQDAGFIAPSAFVCGNVVLGHDTTVFYHSVIRNYHTRDATIIGDHSVIMDRCTLMGQVRVGKGVYLGIGSSLDCCDIHDNVYVGPGAVICLGAVVESNSIIAAGAVIPKDSRVNAGELWAGNPATKVADVTPAQANEIHHIIHDNIAVGHRHIKAINEHVEGNSELSVEWLRDMVKQIEEQQKQVSINLPADIPLEARRFLLPRVYMRRPEMHLRVSYPVNRIAPWMPKASDATSNA